MRKILPLLAVLVLISVLALAQGRLITGQVKDEKGEPLAFTSVTIKGKNKGTTTDANGSFKIEATSADVLVISAVGSKAREIAVGSSSAYNVTLEKSENMQEVVVTALGVQKQPRALGYSVATIKNSELTEARTTNLQNGLVGKVSGLNVSTVNNGVFADTRIVLRGIRSLTGNNQPLLVLDGSPIALSYINSINPNDVESVNVLKGANASALYGPDGVNGVIVVTTKKGSTRKAEISIGNTTLFERISFMPDLQTRFGSGSSYDQFGDGIYDPIENQTWGAEFNGKDTAIGRKDEAGLFQRLPYKYLNGEKEAFFNTGITVQNDVSISAGDDKGRVYLSLQDVYTRNVLPQENARRTGLRLNMTRLFGKFRLESSLGYTVTKASQTNSSAYYNLINSPGQVPVTNYADYVNNHWADHNHYYNDYYPNPYEDIDRLRSNTRKDDIIGNVALYIKPFSWLTITDRLSTTFRLNASKSTTGAIYYSTIAKGAIYQARNDKLAAVSDANSWSSRVMNEFLVSADKSFGDFDVKALGGTSIRQDVSKTTSTSGSNLAIPTLQNVMAYTGLAGAAESNSRARLMSIFGSASLTYKNFATLEFTGRNDWDSRLDPNMNSFFYPGVNSSVILSDIIPALKNSRVVDYLKLKAAWNKTGNVNVGTYELDNTYAVASGFPYGAQASYTANNTYYIRNIRPETVESYETGFELNLFKNRVNFEATYYYQNNNDQVIEVAISSGTGFTSAKLNAARFYNKGVEFDLHLTPLFKAGAFTWNTSGNFSINDSKVLDVYQGINELGIGNTAYIIKGLPAYTHKLTDWQRDAQGHAVVDTMSGYPIQNSVPQPFGRTLPKYILGLNTDFNYKGFSLKIVAEYRGGNYIYNSVGVDYGFTGVDRLSAINGRQRFVYPNSVYWDGSKYVPNADKVVINAQYDFLQASRFRGTQTNYYSSGDFWKLREVILSYDFPVKWMAATKWVKRATVSLIGRNLLMLRPSTNWWTDPEFSNTTSNAIGTTTIGQTPPTRLFGFNVNLGF
jgi:TonB-linked SusC/RagA family outer membrane protein